MSTKELLDTAEIAEQLGTPKDLKRIAELEIPTITTLGELQDYLEHHMVTQSFANAIRAHATHKPMGPITPTVEIGRQENPVTGWFEATLEPRLFGSGREHVRIHGQRGTLAGLSGHQYNLSLPIKSIHDSKFELDRRVEPDAWFVVDGIAGSGEIIYDAYNGEPSTVARVVKEAADELAEAVWTIELRKGVADSISNLALTELSRLR